jgi:hypothetical protein
VADVAFGGGASPRTLSLLGLGRCPQCDIRAKQTSGNAVKEFKPPKLSDIPIN